MTRRAPVSSEITSAIPPDRFWFDPVRRIWHDAPRRKISRDEVLALLIRYAKSVLGKRDSAGTWGERALNAAECSPLYTVKAFIQACSRKSRMNRSKGREAFRLWLDTVGLNPKGDINKEHNRLAGLFYNALNEFGGVVVKRSARILGSSSVFSNVVFGLSFFKPDTAAKYRELLQNEAERLGEERRRAADEHDGVRKYLEFLRSIGISR